MKLRFGHGEPTGLRDDAEFVGVKAVELPHEKYLSDTAGKKERLSWLVRVRGLRLLGPYPTLADAWSTYRGLDERDRALLRMEKRR